jgi:DNA (cytosine-5)-methyltransferase 1
VVTEPQQSPLPFVKCLDLFCCAGGAATGLSRAGFDVTGVDMVDQPRYPFRFVTGDAMTQRLDDYDFDVPMTCDHKSPVMGVYGAKVRDTAKEKRHYRKPGDTRGKPKGVVLPQRWGLPPAYSEFIGHQAMEHLLNA